MCDLCKGPETKTEAEYQDYWVAYCRTCKDSKGNPVLMVWSREHIMSTDRRAKMIYQLMIGSLEEVADRIYGKGNYDIDTNQRSILDHMHIHARPKC